MGSYVNRQALLDKLQSPFASLKQQRNVRPKVLAIFWDRVRPDSPTPSVLEVRNMLDGPTDSVRSYYNEISNGYFQIDFVDLLGPYNALKPWQHYDETQRDAQGNPADTDGDGWFDGQEEKWAEAILKASTEFNFAAYDTNGDKLVSTDELSILILIPGTFAWGSQRPVISRNVPTREPLVVNNVVIPLMVEVYMNSPPLNNTTVGTAAHELAHILVGSPDMYFNYYNPFSAKNYSIMDVCVNASHIDPFEKLKFGWVKPMLVLTDGYYTLRDVETEHEILVLLDPYRRRTDEYFILENRCSKGTSFDRRVPDSGIAVWHIIEKQDIYENLPPPPGTPVDKWNSTSVFDWGRRGIRLIRPVVGDPLNDKKALWKKGDTETGYDLLSTDSDLRHSTLKWADGSPSGFTIKWETPAGLVMGVTIQVPKHWERFEPDEVYYNWDLWGPDFARNYLSYLQLEDALIKSRQTYNTKAAKTEKEIHALIRSGFEYVTEIEGVKIFRKANLLKRK